MRAARKRNRRCFEGSTSQGADGRPDDQGRVRRVVHDDGRGVVVPRPGLVGACARLRRVSFRRLGVRRPRPSRGARRERDSPRPRPRARAPPGAGEPTAARSSPRLPGPVRGRAGVPVKYREFHEEEEDEVREEGGGEGELRQAQQQVTPATTAASMSAMRPTMPPRTAPRKAFVDRRDDHSTRACAATVLTTARDAPKATAQRTVGSARRRTPPPRDREGGGGHGQDECRVPEEAQGLGPAFRLFSPAAVLKNS